MADLGSGLIAAIKASIRGRSSGVRPKCQPGAGFNLTLEEVEEILDGFVRTEGNPEVAQFSGGEPSIHLQIIEMLRAAKARDIRYMMLNTNGNRIANDDKFLSERIRALSGAFQCWIGLRALRRRLASGPHRPSA